MSETYEPMSEAARADLALKIKALAGGDPVVLGEFTDNGVAEPSLADEQGEFLNDLAALLERDAEDLYAAIGRVFKALKATEPSAEEDPPEPAGA